MKEVSPSSAIITLDTPAVKDQNPPFQPTSSHGEPAVYENFGFVTEKIPMASLEEVYQGLLDTEDGYKQEHSVSVWC